MFVEQVIRPTGLLDPVIEVRPVQGQVDDLLEAADVVVDGTDGLADLLRSLAP